MVCTQIMEYTHHYIGKEDFLKTLCSKSVCANKYVLQVIPASSYTSKINAATASGW